MFVVLFVVVADHFVGDVVVVVAVAECVAECVVEFVVVEFVVVEFVVVEFVVVEFVVADFFVVSVVVADFFVVSVVVAVGIPVVDGVDDVYQELSVGADRFQLNLEVGSLLEGFG